MDSVAVVAVHEARSMVPGTSEPSVFVLLVPMLITTNILIAPDTGRTPPVPKLKDQQADLVTLVYREPGSLLKVSEAVTGSARLGSTASAARSPPRALLSPRAGPGPETAVCLHPHWPPLGNRQTPNKTTAPVSASHRFLSSSYPVSHLRTGWYVKPHQTMD